jgi:hypothetical protein
MALIALFISWFAVTNKTLAFQQSIYGEKFSNGGKWMVVLTSVLLFYISLSYISALNFNPFIYFRF